MSTPAYEKSDVSIRGVVIFALSLTVATAGIMVLMVALFDWFGARSTAAGAAAVPVTRVPGAAPAVPPGPVLQGAPGSNHELQDPAVEMEAWDRHMDEILGSSGWVDRNAGVVRVPIDDAKRLLLLRGLPVREEAGR